MKTLKNLKYLHIKLYNRILGFGILEFFISFSLGIIIIVLMWRILLLMQHNWVSYNEKIQMQQKAQIAFDVITTDLVNSSYIKCDNNTVYANTIKTNIENFKLLTQFHAGVLGFPKGSKELKLIDSQAKSEAIAIFYLNSNEERVVTNYENGFLSIDRKSTYKHQDLLALISKNWDQITFFVAGKMSSSKIHISMNTANILQNCTINFKGSFSCDNNLSTASTLNMLGSTILRQNGYIYYIKKSSGMPNLYRKHLGLTKSNKIYGEPVVEGIEQMSIYYKYTDTNNQNAGYFTANELGQDIDQWQKVNAVCIEIVVRSRAELEKEPQSYFFSNKLHTPKDKYIRQTYSTTIAIRNRI